MTQLKKEKLTGIVVREIVAMGSKSQHEAVLLHTSQGVKIEIHLKGTNPFMVDAGLAQLVGQTVIVQGEVSGRHVVIDSLSDISHSRRQGRPNNTAPGI